MPMCRGEEDHLGIILKGEESQHIQKKSFLETEEKAPPEYLVTFAL